MMRCLDALYDAGVSVLYQRIAEKVVDHLKLPCEFTHLDSTSFSLITNQATLQLEMKGYLIFVYCLPVIAHWCFFLDGVFMELTRSKAMRNSMLLCGVAVYYPVI
jgi:hypothetical protein